MGSRSAAKAVLVFCLGAAVLGASGCAGEPAYEALTRPAQAVDEAGNAILAEASYDPDTARFVADWNDYSIYRATKTDEAGSVSPCILVLQQPLSSATWAGACGDGSGPITLGFDGHVFRLAPERANAPDSSWTTIDSNVYAK